MTLGELETPRQKRRSVDQSSDKWQVEIIRNEDIPFHDNFATAFIEEWTYVGEAFKAHHSDDAVTEWKKGQGTIDACIYWLTHDIHASWQNYGHFRLRNTVTNEVIPADLFL